MKLYYSPGACSLTVRILLHEMNLPSDFEEVDLKTKKTKSGEDFLKINPKGAVPALITDDNQALTENAVIHQYLAHLANANALLSSEKDFNRYRTLEWTNFITTDIHKSFGPLFNPIVPEEVKKDIFIPILKKKFEYIEKQLEGKDYLMGETFTLPDAYLFVMLRWLKKFHIDLKEWPNLSLFFSRVIERASVQKSLSEEGLRVSV